MILKSFGYAVLTRTLLLCLSVFVFIYLLTSTSFIATPFIVAALIAAQIYSLVRFVQKTNTDLVRFFESIRYSDFSQSFHPTIRGSSFEALNKAFAGVIDQFRKTRAEKEEQYRYLQIVLQHVGIGLIAFTQDGTVETLNTAAKRLLKVNNLENISELAGTSKALVGALKNIKAGENLLVKFVNENELFQVAVYATQFRMRDRDYTLASLTNIHNELEEREMEAWQNLIRVLTHEIMNSVTPITSLSSTASSLLQEFMSDVPERKTETGAGIPVARETGSDLLVDVKGALDTISRRSEGLLHFVDDYRNLTRIPTPNFQPIQIAGLFGRVEKLFADRMQLRGIKCSVSITPENLELTADPDLLEQVMINLVMNSIGAMAGSSSPEIRLVARTDNRGNVLIHVVDNGHGIPEELQEKIFIPFFTTRKDGSGIGLSLSRQIMRAHKGSITVNSTPGSETVFTLRF